MKILKFRAYIKATGEMLNVSSINMFLNEIGFRVPSKHPGLFKIRRFPFDEIILMQSTELSDYIGIEIFDGDILKLRFPWEKLSPAIVSYDAPHWVSGNDNHCPCTGQFGKHEFGDSAVIGNIHQNPELIEDK